MSYESKSPYIIYEFVDGVKKKYRRSLVKDYAIAITELTFDPQYHEKLDVIEKKALSKYIYFLLSKRDYFSFDLVTKAEACGFFVHNIEAFIEHCKLKGFIDDEKLKRKKDLFKIKKGYSCKRTSLRDDQDAKSLEKETLKKLIIKKKSLLLSCDLKEKAKGYRFLISRGYDINQINMLLQESEV
jgi:SOS response regulatory protein OraA/RecX